MKALFLLLLLSITSLVFSQTKIGTVVKVDNYIKVNDEYGNRITQVYYDSYENKTWGYSTLLVVIVKEVTLDLYTFKVYDIFSNENYTWQANLNFSAMRINDEKISITKADGTSVLYDKRGNKIW